MTTVTARIAVDRPSSASSALDVIISGPKSWSEQLATDPQELKKIDLESSPSSEANPEVFNTAIWEKTTAPNELVFTLPHDVLDIETSLDVVRRVKTQLERLDTSMPIDTITLLNPIPVFVLRHRAVRDTAELITRLKLILYGVDRLLSARCNNGMLTKVVFAAAPGAPPISNDERHRVREFFPAMAQLEGASGSGGILFWHRPPPR